MLSDAGSPETYPGVQQVIELLDSVIDEMSSRSPKGVIDEEEFDITEFTFNPIGDAHGGGPVEVEFESLELNDDNLDYDGTSTFADDEIERQLNELSKQKKLGASAAFAAKALQIKIDSDISPCGVCTASGCQEASLTDCPFSWCQKHEDLLSDSIRKDFRKEMATWPAWLQRKVQEFEGIQLSADEMHQLLYDIAVLKLRELKPRTEVEATSRRDMLKAIATCKVRFNRIPGVLSLLLTLSMSMLFALSSSASPSYATAIAFPSTAGGALMTILIGVGMRRSRALIIPVGYAAMIGVSVGMLSLGIS